MKNTKPLTAVLWDVENVSLHSVSTIIERLNEDHKISNALAFADWTKVKSEKALSFAKYSFEMIHTPHINGLKNSADISMVTHGLNILYHHPNISNFILITGDADFRPLLMELKKEGKYIEIICDSQNASLDLVSMADDYKDYRDIILENISNESEESEDSVSEFTVERAYELLEETVSELMESTKSTSVNSGLIKTKMKLMESSFDEKSLGFNSWKDFVKEAQKKSSVIIPNGNYRFISIKSKSKGTLSKAYEKLINVIKQMDEKKDKNGYVNFSQVASKVNAKNYGYSQFKKLALEAEKRGLVKITSRNGTWLLKLVK